AMKGDFTLKLHADIKQEQLNSDFNLSIDTTKLNGDVAVAGFKQPNIRFNLNADTLDLNKLIGQPKPKTEKTSQGGAADKPADLSVLKTLLLEGKVSIASIIYDQYRLSGLNLAVKA